MLPFSISSHPCVNEKHVCHSFSKLSNGLSQCRYDIYIYANKIRCLYHASTAYVGTNCAFLSKYKFDQTQGDLRHWLLYNNLECRTSLAISLLWQHFALSWCIKLRLHLWYDHSCTSQSTVENTSEYFKRTHQDVNQDSFVLHKIVRMWLIKIVTGGFHCVLWSTELT